MENELSNAGRVPKQSDLLTLCRSLNEHGARYVIVGGFAVIHHGFLRATEDIDLLVDGDPENQVRVKKALEVCRTKQFSNSETTTFVPTRSCAYRMKFWSI